MLDIVNVVSSGSLSAELDLTQIAEDLNSITEYNPDEYSGMYFRIEDELPLITLYRTGKYIVTGADSKEESFSTRERFLNLLADHGIIKTPEDDWFKIQNYVCKGDFEQSLNLNALAVGLGLDSTEYEPEQHPGLIYRPEGAPCVVLLFTTGQVIITGSSDLDKAEEVFERVHDEVTDLLAVD